MRAVIGVVLLLGCSSGPSNEDCSKVGTSAKAFAENKLDDLGGGCTSNDDCVLFRATLSCYTGCFRAIRAGREVSARSELDTLSGNLCEGSSCSINEGCFTVHAECIIGACRTVRGSGTDGGTGDGGMMGTDGG